MLPFNKIGIVFGGLTPPEHLTASAALAERLDDQLERLASEVLSADTTSSHPGQRRQRTKSIADTNAGDIS
ncbi:hypothetical protein [Nocardia seriolae]|uniref:Uncharacterized protein n=1 Tax=Nocardia seriolae TaxID=37332 RepID=A0A0B8N071_9NOCA|nr:hypothetical protein [Nocardia seriolae]APA95308.1 hypothetical protein NS506_01235 [Nocardia seriolae]MTJ66547.1 hypothetical protein [Nocardia seriolae]MTJ70640.1 hypothetical protein [Nocardia seriolae]MTJ85557.1 hypothetical protein [Nocardia seriolae]MTK29555.1 hypothetical protein [Nocardia seriolae]